MDSSLVIINVVGARRLKLGIVGLMMCSVISASAQSLPPQSEILEVVNRVNGHWMDTNPSYGDNRWANAAYMTGAMRVWETTRNPVAWNYVFGWGEKHNWEVYYRANNPTHADEQCAGQTYIDVFRHEGSVNPSKITSIRDNIQIQMDRSWVNDWNWIDAIYMSAPVYARLSQIYTNSAYLDKMHAMYNHTGYVRDTGVSGVNGLYDPASGLWYRDSNWVYPKRETASGQKVFWARGNGWVFAALTRILNEIPSDDPRRPEYEQMFTTMAASLKVIQRSNGYWGASLLDVAEKTELETSGTSFFTYGMAWGVNQGLLSRVEYEPVISKAWNGMLTNSVRADGFLGWIQPEADNPYSNWNENTTRNYGVGAFLLAGIEIALMQGSINPHFYANAGIDQRLTDRNFNGFEPALLDASESYVTNDTITSYKWYKQGELVSEEMTDWKAAGYGSHEFTLIIQAASGSMATDNVTVIVEPSSGEMAATASGWQDPNVPMNTLDNDLGTRWSQDGYTGQWISYALGSTQTVEAVKMAFYSGNIRQAFFDIEVSIDGTSWTRVLTDGASSGTTLELETYDIPDTPAAHVRILGKGNSASSWNSITEVNIQTTPPPLVHDTDSDGIFDWWEVDMLGSMGPNGDANQDGDAFTDQQEYIIGSDPDNDLDDFTVDMNREPGGLNLTLPTVLAEAPHYSGTTRYYAIEQSSSITGNWSAVSGYNRIPATGSAVEVPIDTLGNDHQFYRTKVWIE